jgi:hypothetical protein
MAKEAYMLKSVEGNTQFSLAAQAGESLLVTGIDVFTPSGSYLTMATERTNVGYFRVGGNLGNHLFFPVTALDRPNLLDVMIARGWLKGYPIAEGETMVFTGVHQATSIVAVKYLKGDAGAFKATDPNGSQAAEFLYLSYGRYSGVLADGDNVLVTIQTPIEFPAFPFGEVVPSRSKITLLGIAASDVGVSSATHANQHESQYLKLVRERSTLFDDSRNGLLNRGVASASADASAYGTGQSVLGNNSDVDLRPIFVLPEALTFVGGEELNVNFHTELIAGSANIAAAQAEVCMIQKVGKA